MDNYIIEPGEKDFIKLELDKTAAMTVLEIVKLNNDQCAFDCMGMASNTLLSAVNNIKNLMDAGYISDDNKEELKSWVDTAILFMVKTQNTKFKIRGKDAKFIKAHTINEAN